MSQISRRLFFLLLAALIPTVINDKTDAATKKKPTPTPSPKKKKKKKKPKPTSTSKKPSASPEAKPTQSSVIEGVFIAKSAELKLRQPKVFYLKDSFGISTGYSLTRTSKGVVAFNTRCTHAGAPTNVSGTQLLCPAHGSIFNPENGEVIRGPALDPLKSYQTIEINGEVRIVIS
jgi:Rieske Fe-S protein